ncbi:Proprotein convertase subtilisin/kexin type 6 [Clonorchis sinensis]|uniref:Proprotein convertase subtilisin/kexin type 6 n=1 Tax=Clonorchis sinensis TaxID=79923 RepID=A0A8T1MXB9_CLOSI|nr:Proprotein convertase subtilisin/kexin type 6 [Clonorchis sinensis]
MLIHCFLGLIVIHLGVSASHSNSVICEGSKCYLEFEEWVVQVPDGALAAKLVARCMGLDLIRSLNGFDNMYLLRAPKLLKNRNSLRLLRCTRSSSVVWAQRQVPLIREKRSLSPSVRWNDPLYPQMWYIIRHDLNQGYDMNVQEAWLLGYSGKGVVVTIMDDGVDHNHTDLKKNYDPQASYDFNDNDPDPMPNWRSSTNNKHGTRCAGQVAAEGNNSKCMVGIAFNSRIGGIRMLDGYITDRLEADTLHFRNDHIHIYSGSWGPEDTGKLYEGPGVLTQSAFQKGIASGRNNFGNIYVWASGNGGSQYDSCACDGYASSPFTLSVSGVGERNLRPWYLEECSSTLVTTYSSGAHSEKMIATVDPNQKCTTTHTGTSASAPIAAGIIALLLEANPRLSWRDVQYVTLLAANPAPFLDGNFTKNAVGRSYSLLYGYGLMDAGKMVRLGELWRGLPPHHQCTSRVMNYKARLDGIFNLTFPLVFYGCDSVPRSENETYSNYTEKSSEEGSPVVYLEHVQLYADIVYQRRGLLQITLISPSGTQTVLLPPRRHDEHSGNIGLLTWPLTTVQLWGESAKGTWYVRVDNLAASKPMLGMGSVNLDSVNGYWRSAWIIAYGTDKYPIRLRPPNPERPPPPEWFAPFAKYVVDDSLWKEVYTCHVECAPGGCTGPGADQCLGGCRHYATQSRQCVPECPRGTTPYGALRISVNHADYNAEKTHRNRVRPGRIRSSNSFVANVVCQPCWTLCGTCVRPHTEYDCMSCSNGRYLLPLITPDDASDVTMMIVSEVDSDEANKKLPSLVGTCRTECPVGYYANKSSSICNRCSANCMECSGPGTGECSKCNSGFRLTLGRCVDGNSVDGRCSPGQYLKDSHCVDCDQGCDPTGCLPDGDCSRCKSDFPYILNSSCVKACPTGWFAGPPLPDPFTLASTSPDDGLSHPRRCEPCPPGCQDCTAFENCTRCADGLNLQNGTCISTSVSLPCHPQCATCFRSPFDCLTCPHDRVLLPNVLIEQVRSKLLFHTASLRSRAQQTGSTTPLAMTSSYLCPSVCPHGTFADQSADGTVCRACPPSCSRCTAESHCLECWPSFYLAWGTGRCLPRVLCRQSEYYDAVDRTCLPCAAGCATCIGPLPTHCTSCSTLPPTPSCLYVTGSEESKSNADLTDSPWGQCVPCCPYRVALLSRSPKDCMFCVADRASCMSGAEINAGEGLLFEEVPPAPELIPSWLTKEPSRLILFVLCGILMVGVCTFLTIHTICAWRRRRLRGAEPITMAVRRRRRREVDGPNYSEDGDGAKMSLKGKVDIVDGTGNSTVGLDNGFPQNADAPDSERAHKTAADTLSTSSNRTPPHQDRHRRVLYVPLVSPTPSETCVANTGSQPCAACTTHLSDEYCSRSVPLPTKHRHDEISVSVAGAGAFKNGSASTAVVSGSNLQHKNKPREIKPF